jgi:hypothetical protein
MLTVNGVPTPETERVSYTIKIYNSRKSRLPNSKPRGLPFRDPLFLAAQAENNALCAGGGELLNVREMRIWYESKTAGIWWVCKNPTHIDNVNKKIEVGKSK